jgi:hypothetical protein
MSDKKQLLWGCSAALLAAVALLIIFVLPAEYGWDPLGSGEALGLLDLSQEVSAALQVQEKPWRSDHRVFELAPFESVEFKYRLEQGAAMVYAWQAGGEVLFEMHAEPDGAAPGYAQTFNKASSDHDYGNYSAPFPGIHGWFWQNRSQDTVTVNLVTAGFYTAGISLRDGFSQSIDFEQDQP